uniref:Regulatory protein zeste n=1 Tax=Culicoides sonorensis TaxID=179676 RepID=A0A336N2N5_CULSO
MEEEDIKKSKSEKSDPKIFHGLLTPSYKKHVKITKHQKSVLLEFLEKNFEYCRGTFKLLPGSESHDKNVLWDEVTTRLNGIGPAKTSNMWRKTCADLRMQIKKKVIEEKELTDEDKRMAKFYGLRSSLDKSSRLVNDRVTAEQKTKMIELIRDNYYYNQSTLKLEAKTPNSMEWDEIGEILNRTGGCKKGTIAWRKCWSDIKCDVGKKFANGAVPKMLTEDEYQIATIYGWLNGDQVVEMDQDSAVQYVIDPTVIIKSEADDKKYEMLENIQLIADENEDYIVEHLDENEEESEDQPVDDTVESQIEDHNEETQMMDEQTSVFEKNSESIPNPEPSQQNQLLEQILAAQLRTNTLLEQLLERNSESNTIQNGILSELKNNSFMMVNRAFQK